MHEEETYSYDDGFITLAKTVKPKEIHSGPDDIISGPLFFASPVVASPSEEPVAKKSLRFSDANN